MTFLRARRCFDSSPVLVVIVVLLLSACAAASERGDRDLQVYNECPVDVVSAVRLDEAVCGAGCLLDPPVPWFLAELSRPELTRFVALHGCVPPREYLLSLRAHESEVVRSNVALLLAYVQ